MTEDINTSKNSRNLVIQGDPKKSREEQIAEIAFNGMVNSALLSQDFGKTFIGEIDLTAACKALANKASKVNNNNMNEVETMLVSQASALDIIFTKLALNAKANMGEYLDAADRYMRLALKAQAQCRATLETLANIKNPPVVIARQANISHGPQQVNNNARSKTDVTPTHAEKSNSVQNKLLENKQDDQMDIGAPSATIESNSQMETVDAINRT